MSPHRVGRAARRITLLLAMCLAFPSLAAERLDAVPPREADRVVSIATLPGSQGWVLMNRRLLWSEDDGITWREDLFVAPPGARLATAQFLDGSTGWIVVTGNGRTEVVRTVDAGETWDHSLEVLVPGGEEPAGASLSFISETTGFLLLKLPSSGNFSRGALFRTEDGGRTWRSLPTPPVGGAVRFFSERNGWLAGGPAGTNLFVTRDGGRSWEETGVAPPQDGAKLRRVYFLPAFDNDQDGLLPVRLEPVESGEASIALYETRDGGRTWTLQGSGVGAGPVDLLDHAVITTDRSGNLVTLSREGRLGKVRSRSTAGPRAGFHVRRLSFSGSHRGWAVTSADHCAGFKEGCWTDTRILRTRDRGETFDDVTPAFLIEENLRAEAESSRREPARLLESSITGSGTQIIQDRDGFDKGCYLPVETMSAWWPSPSPYWYVGVYIGGVNAYCVNHANEGCPCPSKDWFSEVSAQGWTFIPTWVGPQIGSISPDPGTAFNQGAAEANAAADKMAALGFPEWSIVYYDFEDPSSDAKVKSFISGWTSQLHNRHQNAGIYGSYLSTASWQGSGVQYPPDAVWIFKLDGVRSVYNLCGPQVCVPDDIWNDHERIHQYVQNVSDTQGGIYDPIIDKNYADGRVAVYGAAPSSTTVRIKATLDGSAWPYGSSTGVLSWQLTGPTPRTGGGVPSTLSGLQPGVYTLVRASGGPSGASLASITPAGSQTLTAGGSLAFTFNFVSGGQCTPSTSATCTPPTVTLTANPTAINAGSSSTLTWSSSDATSCVASGGWSGTQSTSGSKSVTPSGTTIYTLTCSGTGGSTSKSVTVTVNSANGPQVYLAAYPQSVTAGTAVGLGWATSNATSCTASGGWSGSRPVSGGATVFPSTTTAYTLTCTGPGGGTGSASVTVSVTSSPSISLSADPPAIDPGGTSTLQWTTTGMTSCSASGSWSGSKALSGSQQVSPSSTATYNLSCNGTPPPPQERVSNGGFSGTVTQWTLGTNFYANSNFGSCNLTCPGYAYVSEPNGSISLSNNLFGTMRQDISLPSTASSITLTFWVSISTLETGSTPYDVLSVSLLNTQGSPLQLIQTFSNVNAGGYRKTTFDLTPYKGQTVRLSFVGTTDATNGTVFRVDDVSVLATMPAQQYTKSATLTVKTPPPPGLSFTATPDVLAPGESSTLSWSSSGTTSCTASNGWSGSRSTSGSQVVTPGVTTTYTLSCSGSGGTVSSSETVVVKPPISTGAARILLFASRQACAGTEPAVLLGWTMPEGTDPLVTIRRSDGKYVATVNTNVKGPVHEVASGLVAGNAYRFRVEANLNGSMIVSNELAVPIGSDECRLPVAAGDLPHRPVLWAEKPYCENGVAKVRLFWTEALGAESFTLDRIAIFMDSATYAGIGAQERSWIDSNLTPGAGAVYELDARNAAGSVSAWHVGIVVPGTVCDTAGAPGSFAAQADEAVCSEGRGSVTVRWDQSSSAAANYRVFEFEDHLLTRIDSNEKDFVEELTSLRLGTVSRVVIQAQSSSSATEFREAWPLAQMIPGDVCGASTLLPALGGASASYIRTDQALLRVGVIPNGSDTAGLFEWGPSTSYGFETGGVPVGNGFSSVTVGQVVTGLSCGTTYHFRGVAVSGSNRINGTDQTFTTAACPPTAPSVKDQSVDGITQTGATLHALVNPNGFAGTNAYFQYGTNPALFAEGTNPQPMGSGTDWLPAAAVIDNLTCGTVYHYRAIAYDSAFQTSVTPFQSFTTAACPPPPATSFYTVTPCRVLDTRNPSDAPAIFPAERRRIVLAGKCGIPATAKSVSVNLTVVNPQAAGFLALYPAVATPPATSTISFRQGQVRGNNAVIGLGADGGMTVFCFMEDFGSVDFVVDVNGYFQ